MKAQGSDRVIERTRYRKKLFKELAQKGETGILHGEGRHNSPLSLAVAPIPRKLSRKLSRKHPFSRAHRALAAPRMHVQLGRVPRGVWSEWLSHESRSRSGELASYWALFIGRWVETAHDCGCGPSLRGGISSGR